MNMMMKFMMMMTVMQGFNQGSSHNYGRHKCAHGGAGGCKDHDQYRDNFSFDDNQDMRDMMDKMRMMTMMKKMMGDSGNQYSSYQGNSNYERMPEMNTMFSKMMSSMRFKRQADDALALNDRLKEKLEGVMT